MRTQHTRRVSRRKFLRGVTLAGTAGLLGVSPRPVAAEPPPETTTIRWLRSPAICVAPYYVAEELLHGEGFTEVRHVQTSVQLWTQAVLSGEVDIVLNFVGPLLVRLDAGDPVVILAGGHVGCFELFGTEGSARSVTSRARPSACRSWGLPSTSSWRASRPTWAWTPARTSTG